MITNVAIAAALLVAAAGSGWYARSVIADRDIATLRATHDQALTVQARNAQAAEATQRAEEARRSAAIQEIANVAHTRTKAREVAARTAASTGDGLRIDAAAFAAATGHAGSDPGVACVRQADSRAAVLADLLGRVEAAGREMARVANESRDAGQACEASYNALKGTP